MIFDFVLKIIKAKKRRVNIAFLLIVTAIIFISVFSYNLSVYAATYNFVQSSWIGGVDTVSVATHPTNQSNWTKFSTSTDLVTGSSVQLTLTSPKTFIDDGATSTTAYTAFGGGFSNGANVSTVVSGVGTSASVILATTSIPSPNVVGSYAATSARLGIVFDSSTNSIWVPSASSYDSSVTKINVSTGAVVGVYNSGASGDQEGATFDPSTNSVWTTNYTNGTITKLNASTGAIVGTYTVGGNPWDATFGSTTDSIFVSNNNGYVTKLNASTGAIIYNRSIGYSSIGIAFDPVTNSVWTANYTNNTVTKIDASTGSVIGTYTVGTEPYGMTLDPSTDSIWVANYQSSNVTKLNASTGAVTGTYGGGLNPTDVTFNNLDNSIWVSNATGNKIKKISASTGALLGTYTVSNPFGITFDPSIKSIWTSGSGVATKIALEKIVYATSGIFTSSVIRLNIPSKLTTLSYTKTTSASTTVTMDIRAGDTPTPDSSWTAWITNIASGGSINTLGTKQYVQYRTNLSTTDQSFTPSLNSVTIGYKQYGSGTLTSSIYNSGDATNLVTNMFWTATGTSTVNTIKFQIRSASTSAAVASAPWCGTSSTCDGTSYFTDSNGGIILPSNHPLRSGGNDSFFQYKVFLSSSNGASTPVLTSATVQYVVNAPPQFDSTYGTNGVLIYQNATSSSVTYGGVLISYKVRDPDSTTGSVTPGYITPSFEYNTGSGWVSIPSSALATGGITNKVVDNTIYKTYQTTWFATSTVSDIFASTTQVRVAANDNEAANNITKTTSVAFVLDTKKPTITATLDASTGTVSQGTITFSATDDSQFKYRVCNDGLFPSTDAQGNSCVWSVLSGNKTNINIPISLLKDSQGNNVVYIEVQDKYGNTSNKTLVAPATPTSFYIKDVSNPPTNSYKEFINWGVFVATTSSSFSSYKLYTSTNGTAYSLLTTITNPALNYFTDTITTATTSTRYYKITSVTTQGNTSAYTNVLSDVPNGQGGTDTTPPVITSSSIQVPSSSLKNSSAIVTFTTDELAKGTVQYRKSGTTSWTTISGLTYSLSHSIFIQGLTPNTLYNIQVKAQDISGNTSNYVSGTDFTTVGGPVITNISETSITDTTATIVWNTSTSSNSFIEYSNNQTLASSVIKGSSTYVSCVGSVCQHSVQLTALTSATTYYFSVKSTDSSSNTSIDTNGGNYYSFHTTLDVTPPIISNITIPLISSTAAIIVWQTDKPSTTQVKWGTASGSLTRTTVLNSVKTVYHIAPISGSTNDTKGAKQTLTASTKYFYKVFSTDSASNTASSTEQNLTTLKDGTVNVNVSTASGGTGTIQFTTPPTIKSVVTKKILPFSADINIVTDRATTAFVEYGTTIKYGATAGDANLLTTKIITIPSLQEGTDYHYRVLVFDKLGNTTVSKDYTFKTEYISQLLDNRTLLEKTSDVQGKLQELIESSLPALSPPFISTPIISSTTETTVTITWKTNIKSTGLLRYATDKEYTSNNNTYKTELSSKDTEGNVHLITLNGLKSGTLYHFQARSYVFPQVVGKTKDITFKTKNQPIVPHVSNVSSTGVTVVWETKKPTSSVVTYKDTRTGESKISEDETKKMYHSIQLKDLSSGTRYSIKVSAQEDGGKIIKSASYLNVSTIVDVTPPVISNFSVDNALVPGRAGLIQTVIRWKTDKPANSVVYYDEGVYGSSTTTKFTNNVESLDLYTNNHVMILSDLRAGTVYSVKAVSTDKSGNTRVFGPTNIITPNQTKSVLDIMVKKFESTFKFLGA